MPRSLGTAEHEALRQFLIQRRKEAGLSQTEVAKRMHMHQPHVSLIERGERRVDAVELIELSRAIGFDPLDAIRVMLKSRYVTRDGTSDSGHA